ncbi:MAG: glycosyltransferase family 4 protein [Pseudomonadota bacterium]
MKAVFAVPGEIESPTGGYGYARRLLAGLPAEGVETTHLALPLPAGDGHEAEILELLASVPAGTPILLDGLAGGALPGEALAALPCPVAMLCHHPLADEAGLEAGERARLATSERAALTAADLVLTTSHATATTLVGTYGVPHRKIVVAPPGTEPASPAAGSDSEVCQILSVGSLTPRKGHHMLLDALAKAGATSWHLRIAGHAPEPDFAAALARRAARLGLSDRVEFLGPLEPEALAAAYHRSDLFALASVYEGFGMAFAEAVARGLPTLGISSAAVREATQGAALLVTPKALPDALARLIAEPAYRQELAEAAARQAPNLARWPETLRVVAGALGRLP